MADLSTEQLLELLRKKGVSTDVLKTVTSSLDSSTKQTTPVGRSDQSGKQSPQTVVPTSLESTSPSKGPDETAKCSFRPTKSNQQSCGEKPDVFYNMLGYCTKHRRTVQALNAKKEDETRKDAEIKKEAEAKARAAIEAELQIKAAESKKVPSPNPRPGPATSGGATGATRTPLSGQTSKTQERPSQRGGPLVEQSTPRAKKRITPNKWGKFEDPDTGIVFDPKTHQAYGVQDRITGRILSLTQVHIRLCNRYGWKYMTIPETNITSVCDVCTYNEDECICEADEENIYNDDELGEEGEGDVDYDEEVEGEEGEENIEEEGEGEEGEENIEEEEEGEW